MGMTEMFDSKANFSGLFEKSKTPTKVTNVLHKAVMAINEDGAEVAATSGNNF